MWRLGEKVLGELAEEGFVPCFRLSDTAS
jgi:hypothetical protein